MSLKTPQKSGISRGSFTSRRRQRHKMRSLRICRFPSGRVFGELGVCHRGRQNEPDVVCLEVKSVGKPCAGKPHARFDERGWETELWHRLRHRQMTKVAGNSYSLMPKATAPIFDSTLASSQTLGLTIACF